MNNTLQNFLEITASNTGQTLEAIAKNPVLKTIDQIFGLDWLMTFLGKVNSDKIKLTVNEIRSTYPHLTSEEIAHHLIIKKTWEAGRLGLITNIIPPVAAVLLGVELIATAKLQAEMVYEIAHIYGLDINQPARRGEVLAIVGLSFSADLLKTGLSIIEIIPGIGAVIGASTNAAMLYVLGKTTCNFYEGKTQFWQKENNNDWQFAFHQSQVMDRILAYMVRVTYPELDWSEILPNLNQISPSSIKNVVVNLDQDHSLESLLQELSPDFAPMTLKRCCDIAQSNGEITTEERQIINRIALKFNLNLKEFIELQQKISI